MACVEYFDQSGSPSFGYRDIAITRLPSTLCPCASQMNLREEAKAKSLTLSALKTQVFLPPGFDDSLAFASCGVTTKTGSRAVSACFRRWRCAGVRTSCGF